MTNFKTFNAVGCNAIVVDINESGKPDDGDLLIVNEGHETLHKIFSPAEDRVETIFTEGDLYSEEDMAKELAQGLPLLGSARLRSYEITPSEKFGEFMYGVGKAVVSLPYGILMFAKEHPIMFAAYLAVPVLMLPAVAKALADSKMALDGGNYVEAGELAVQGGLMGAGAVGAPVNAKAVKIAGEALKKAPEAMKYLAGQTKGQKAEYAKAVADRPGELGALGTGQPAGPKWPTVRTAAKKPPAEGPGFLGRFITALEILFWQGPDRLIRLANEGNKQATKKLCEKAKKNPEFVKFHIKKLLDLAKKEKDVALLMTREKDVAFLINHLIGERPAFFYESDVPGVVEVAKAHSGNNILAHLPERLAATNKTLANKIIDVLFEKVKEGDDFAASSLAGFAIEYPKVTERIIADSIRDGGATSNVARRIIMAERTGGIFQRVLIDCMIKRMDEVGKIGGLLRRLTDVKPGFIEAFINHLIDSAKDAGEAKDQIVSLAKAQPAIAPEIMSAAIEKVKKSGLKGTAEKTVGNVIEADKARQMVEKIIEEYPELLSAEHAEALLLSAARMGRSDMADLAIKWIEGQKLTDYKFIPLLIEVADISDKALPALKREAILTGDYEIRSRIIADLSAAINNPKIAAGAVGELLSLAKDLQVESSGIVCNLIKAAKESEEIALRLKDGIKSGTVHIESSHVDTLVEGVKKRNLRMGLLLQTFVEKGSTRLDMRLRSEQIIKLGDAAAEGNLQAAQILKTSALVNKHAAPLCIALLIAASKERIIFDVLSGLIDEHPELFAPEHKGILDRLHWEKAAKETGRGATYDENYFARALLLKLQEKRPDLFDKKTNGAAK